MINSPSAVKSVLERLVSPKYEFADEYDISFEKHDDTGEVWCIVDVTLDHNIFVRMYEERGYDSVSMFEYDLQTDIQNALKYLGIYKSIITFYTQLREHE
jgi:hypothetical protein